MGSYKKIILFLNVVFIVGIFLVGVSFAWTNPSTNPPGGNGALYYSSGNIGIGTGSPAAPLHINGGTAMSGGWNRTVMLQSTYPVLGFNSAGSRRAGIGYDYSSAMIFWVNSPSDDVSAGTVAMSIKNDGSVGIGLATPDSNYKLTTSGGGVKAENNSATQPALYVSNAGGGDGILVGSGGITLGGVNRTTWPSSGTSQWTTTGNDIYYNTGSVGIGTASPGYQLSVKSSIAAAADIFGITADDNGAVLAVSKDASDNAQFNLYTGVGTASVQLNASGNSYFNSGSVGIGTTAPSDKLEVAAGSGGRGIFSNGGGASRKALLFEGPGTTHPAYSRIDSFDYGTALPLNLVLADSGGNVGIGTASPGYKLDINTTGAEDAQIAIRNTSTGNSKIYFDASDGDLAGGDYAWLGQDNNLKFGISTASSGGDIYLMPKGGNGNVGIGIATPSGKLHAQTASRSSAFASDNGATWHDLIIQNPNSTQNAAVGIAFELNNSYHVNAGTGIAAVKSTASSDYGADLAFITRPQSAGALERMRILSTGNIGIGKTNPSYKLDVAGDVNITGSYRVNGTPISTGGGINYQVFNSSGTFVVPAGVTKIRVQAWGGGGGGHPGPYYGGGGGGGGAFGEGIFTVTPGNSYPVVIGAGGAGGIWGSTYGASGGTSSFEGNVFQVSGGVAVGGGTEGDFGYGGSAVTISGGLNGVLVLRKKGFNGSSLGAGGQGADGGEGGAIATAGTSPGGGGGGGNAWQNGYAGAAGRVIIYW